MSDLFITTRRNFLVRAAGFIAAVSPVAAAAAMSKPDLPVITPHMVEKIAAWKRMWPAYVAAEEALRNDRYFKNYPGGELTPVATAYHDAKDTEHAARMEMLRAILGLSS